MTCSHATATGDSVDGGAAGDWPSEEGGGVNHRKIGACQEVD